MKQILLLLLMCVISCITLSQCPITVSSTPSSTTICSGNSVNLSASSSAAGTQYSWTPITGLSSGSISNPVASPTSTTTYTVTGMLPSGSEMIVNGGFESGNTGFSSNYTYVSTPSSTALWTEGTYTVGSDPHAYHGNFPTFPDHTSGAGTQFQIVNGAAGAGTKVWCQTIAVVPGQSYVFSCWAASIVANSTSELAILNFDINGTNIGSFFSPTLTSGQWTQYTTSWTCPAGVNSITLCIENENLTGSGNDFGIDDISFKTACIATSSLTVNVINPVASNNGPICSGQTVNLSGGAITGATYAWTGIGLTANNTQNTTATGITSSGTYTLNVTSGGVTCPVSTSVTVNPLPATSVSPTNSTICLGQSVALTGTVSAPVNTTVTATNNTSTSIPDAGVVYGWTGTGGTFSTSNLVVSGLNTNWTLTSIVVNISHTWDSDLIAYLYNPCGNSIQLINSNGGSGINFTNTTYTPSAVTAISSGSAPFTGTFIPAGGSTAWSNFITASQTCSSANGTWSIHIGDDAGGDAGVLNSWVLNFNNPNSTSYVWSPTTNMTGSNTLSPTITPTSTGTVTYTITANNTYNCSATATTSITVNPIPTITINNATVCNGTSATLTATPSAGGGTYLWSPGGETTASITVSPSSTTTYSCVYTLSGCPSPSVSGTVTVNPIPTITINNATVCNGTSATLTATPSVGGGTYLWSPGGQTTASITVSPSSTTTYSCVYTLSGCPSPSVSGIVTVNPIPTITINNATVCNGTSATLTATPSAGGGTYLWSPGGQTTASITVSPSSSTTYSCVYTLSGCPSPSVSGTVTVNPIPTITINNATVCNGTSATLTAAPSAGGGTYLWSPGGETTASITVSPSSTTTYSCVYTLSGCSSPSVTGTVTVNPIPTITINNATVCNGTSATLTATPSAGGGTYLWSPGGQTTASITVSPSSTTTYSCVYTLSGCPSPSVSGTVTVNPIPTITINNATVCNGTSATLTATPSTGGGTYLWSPGGQTTASITVSPSSTTSYSCVYTLSGCPSPSVSGTVTVNPIPTITINNATVCNGTSATLTATPSAGGGTYLWSPGGQTTTSITVSPSSTTTYSCVYTLSGCPSPSVSGTVTVNPIPTITINNATVCNGTSATLTATPSAGGGTYLWSPGGQTTASITVSPSSTTTYSCVYTLSGCPSPSVSGTVTVNPIPTITINNATVCNGTSATLTATPSAGGGTYLWSPGGQTTASITVSPSSTTTYSCVYTLSGCPSPSVSGTVTVNPIPTITINNATVCNGTNATLTATPSAGGGTYLWSPGGETTASITVSPSSTTSYSCVYTLSGCPSPSVSGTVTVNPIPTITINNATVCNGTSATLTATPSAGGGTYLWSPGGQTTASITVSPSSTTTYSCVYTLNGCPSPSVSGTVTVNPIPTITINNATVCNGTSATLTATPSATGGTYLWSPGGETTASITYSPSTTTSCSCVYTLSGCPSPSVSGTVTVNPIPTITINNATVCNGTSATLTATPSAIGGTYLWSPGGETTASITVSPSSTTSYSCVYTLTGCPSPSVTGTVTVNPIPTITIVDQTVCNGTSATLTATPSAGGGTYLWSPGGETTASITVSPSSTTTYSCVYTLSGCPSPSVSGTVTVNPIPTITINNATVCNGTSATLTATPSAGGGTYLWSPGGETTTSITVSPSSTTTYSCVYTLSGCPSPSVSGTVTVNPIPTITINNATVCNGTSATLTATPSAGGGTYLWSPGGQTTASITVSPSSTTTYSCVYTLSGCPSPSVSGTVTVNPIPTITINNATVCNGTSATLTATPSAAGGTYLWSPGGQTTASITYSPSTTTSYSCVYTLTGCPSPSVTGTVTVNPIPTITIPDVTICDGASGTLTATPSLGGGTYLWSPGGETTASITYSPSTTTSYSCVYTLTGCPSPSVTASIIVSPAPTLAVSSTTICNGSSGSIMATPSAMGGTYLWNEGTTTASLTASPSSTTTYSVTYSYVGCPDLTQSGTITVNPVPTITINNTTVCNGTSATLTATPSATGGTYLWSPGGETIASITYSPSTTTSYSCVYTLSGCPSPSVSGTVTVNPIPTITINNATVCNGTSATLTATPSATGGTYLWSPGGETTASITYSPSTTTSYSCVYTLSGCPSPSVSGTVTVNPIPTITINNATVCNGTSATLTVTPSLVGGTYLWSPGGETTASITVSPSSTTSYSCVYTLSGCPSPSVSGTVTVNPIPTITINNATVCNGTSATLTATPSATGGTYLWSPGGETTASITYSPSTTTSYSCVYTLSGCPSPSVTGTVTVNPIPTITIVDQTVCNGTSATLTATPSAIGGTYLWSPGGETTASITYSPSTTTSYSCVYTLSGCPSPSVTGTINVNQIPTITINNATVCNGTSATLTVTPSAGGGTYLWSPGGETTASITVSPSSTTSYSCVYTLTGCPSPSVTGTVTVNPIPTITIVDQTVCNGTSATLTATPSAGGGTYLWSPGGETTASITVSPSSTTTYSCVYTLSGCPSPSVSGTVTVNPIPTITINNATVCNGTSATLTATPSAGGGTYLWSPGGETTTSITVSPSSTTTYSCVYTLSGCPSPSVSGTVTVNPIPTITINNATVCNGTSATLTATPSLVGGTYLWSPGGETTASITYSPSTTTSYSCVYTLSGCPSPSVSGTVTVNPIPTITINNATVCNGTSATLTATPSLVGGTYLWSPGGETTASITYSPSTTTSYSCVYTLSGCPSPSVSGTVTVNPIPTITIVDQTVCNGTSATLTATPSLVGGTYLWSPGGETTASITYSPSTTTSYSCVYTLTGCPSPSVTGTINVNQIPTTTAGSNSPICEGSSLNLTATSSSVPNTTYSWSATNAFTSSNQNPIVGNTTQSDNGSYTVTVSANGCSSTSQVNVVINVIPTVDFVGDILKGCVPLKVNFTNNSTPTSDNVIWSFGDNSTSTNNGNVVSHTYNSPGSYTVTLTSTTSGCTNFLTMNSYITVNANAVAHFTPSSNSNPISNPIFSFTNNSSNATSYNWIFGDGQQSTEINPTHTFPYEPGNNDVILIANNAGNCPDTFRIVVEVTDELLYYIPNTFTPDDDNYNQTFQPVFSAGVDPYSYTLYIFNRWGELIFESHDLTKGWNGKYGDQVVQDDVYVWKVIFKETRSDKRIENVGHVNVLR